MIKPNDHFFIDYYLENRYPQGERDLPYVIKEDRLPELEAKGLIATPPSMSDLLHLIETAARLWHSVDRRSAGNVLAKFDYKDQIPTSMTYNMRSVAICALQFGTSGLMRVIRPDAVLYDQIYSFERGDSGTQNWFERLAESNAVDRVTDFSKLNDRLLTKDLIRELYEDFNNMRRFLIRCNCVGFSAMSSERDQLIIDPSGRLSDYNTSPIWGPYVPFNRGKFDLVYSDLLFGGETHTEIEDVRETIFERVYQNKRLVSTKLLMNPDGRDLSITFPGRKLYYGTDIGNLGAGMHGFGIKDVKLVFDCSIESQINDGPNHGRVANTRLYFMVNMSRDVASDGVVFIEFDAWGEAIFDFFMEKHPELRQETGTWAVSISIVDIFVDVTCDVSWSCPEGWKFERN